MRRLSLIVAAGLLIAALAGACSNDRSATPPKPGLYGLVRSPKLVVGSIPSADSAPGPLPVAARPGGVSLTFFGYTGCGRRCDPSTTALRQALDSLNSSAADRVDVAMISVDPVADTPEKMTEYLAKQFGATPIAPARLHALRITDTVEQANAEEAFAAAARLTPGKDNTYTVSFTATIYAVDANGVVQCEWPFGTSGAEIASDLRLLLGRAR